MRFEIETTERDAQLVMMRFEDESAEDFQSRYDAAKDTTYFRVMVTDFTDPTRVHQTAVESPNVLVEDRPLAMTQALTYACHALVQRATKVMPSRADLMPPLLLSTSAVSEGGAGALGQTGLAEAGNTRYQ